MHFEGDKARQARLDREAKEALKAKGAEFVNEGPADPESPGMGEINPPKGLPEGVRSLVLTFDTNNGNFQVAGPIGDQCLCYGMAVLAILQIFKHHEQQALIKAANKQGPIPGMLEP